MKNIALIGPRGVGKSKISKRISKITELPVLSTDSLAVYETGGISISDFVLKHKGDWRPFRDLEFSILQKLSTAQGIILDCGGGILFDVDENGEEILSERKVSILREIAMIIFLDNDIDHLVEKVSSDKTRPTLNTRKNYKDILKFRIPHYKEVAHYRLYLGEMKKEEAAKRIIELTDIH
ncbi:MAG: shikimate kinase [Leptospiraceae bacterium]|jgi:shikimate kinase|nr:shikimate kinase [Leptospiraceae bacterium]